MGNNNYVQYEQDSGSLFYKGEPLHGVQSFNFKRSATEGYSSIANISLLLEDIYLKVPMSKVRFYLIQRGDVNCDFMYNRFDLIRSCSSISNVRKINKTSKGYLEILSRGNFNRTDEFIKCFELNEDGEYESRELNFNAMGIDYNLDASGSYTLDIFGDFYSDGELKLDFEKLPNGNYYIYTDTKGLPFMTQRLNAKDLIKTVNNV